LGHWNQRLLTTFFTRMLLTGHTGMKSATNHFVVTNEPFVAKVPFPIEKRTEAIHRASDTLVPVPAVLTLEGCDTLPVSEDLSFRKISSTEFNSKEGLCIWLKRGVVARNLEYLIIRQ
jgi:hypothetical protein